MSDLISRQAAIEALRLIPCDLGERELEDAIKAVEQLPPARTEPLTIRVNNELTKEEYEKLMHDMKKDAPIVLLPSVQPERWIPCSERLPEIGQSVLLSVGGMYSAEGCLREDGDWAQFRWDAIQRKDMVGAWKPLPEPYKGEQE